MDGKYTATFTDLAYGSYLVSPKAGSTDTSDKRGTDAILLNVLNSTAVEQDLKSTYPTIQKTVENAPTTRSTTASRSATPWTSSSPPPCRT